MWRWLCASRYLPVDMRRGHVAASLRFSSRPASSQPEPTGQDGSGICVRSRRNCRVRARRPRGLGMCRAQVRSSFEVVWTVCPLAFGALNTMYRAVSSRCGEIVFCECSGFADRVVTGERQAAGEPGQGSLGPALRPPMTSIKTRKRTDAYGIGRFSQSIPVPDVGPP